MRSKITHVVIIVVIIIILSIIAIFIKDIFTKSEIQKLKTTEEIANTLVEIPNQAQGEVKPEDIISVKNGAIAVIDIPSVGVRGQVVEGTDDETLKNYIGKFEGCSYPGNYGNFSVAAHNNIHTEIFRDLHKVKVGEKVRVITKEKEYIYIVNSIEKIEPTRIDVLNENKSVQEITLITCSDMAKTRICVKGTLNSINDI